MQFQTPVDIPKSDIKLCHSDRIIMLGSCFADHMAQKLEERKFDVLSNPFGTLYNPMSIEWLLNDCIYSVPFDTGSELIFKGSDGLYHSWMHHSSFSSATTEELLEKMNRAQLLTQNYLKEAKTLIVTFGSAVAYWHKKLDILVANCHKQKDRLFYRELMDVENTTLDWVDLLSDLHQMNPQLQVIFTISPIRHQRDGFQMNQLSKSTLFLIINSISAMIKEKKIPIDIAYFPAYEIMMDELRDYRFYAEDMIHPSEVAIDYIWERFCQTHISPAEQAVSNACMSITKALSHKPLHPESDDYQKFLRQTLKNIQQLQKEQPTIHLDKEIALCNTILKKSQK